MISKINCADLWLALIIVIHYGFDKPVPGVLWFFLVGEFVVALIKHWGDRRLSLAERVRRDMELS